MRHYTIIIVMPKAEKKLKQFYNLELPELGGWIYWNSFSSKWQIENEVFVH